MLNTKHLLQQSNHLTHSTLSSSNQHNKKMNINVAPLSLCPSPTNKSNTQKGQKQLENKPLSAKNMTQPKKLALFQSVSNLKIKDSITKKRKSEQNLLKGAKGEKSSQYQQQNQPLLTQISSAPSIQQMNVFYMTEGNELKESNLEYFQAQKIDAQDKRGYLNGQDQTGMLIYQHPQYQMQFNQLQNQLIQQQHINYQINQQYQQQQEILGSQKATSQNENISKQANKTIVPNTKGNQSNIEYAERSLSEQKLSQSHQMNVQNVKSPNNQISNSLLQKNSKQAESAKSIKKPYKKNVNMQVQVNLPTYVNSPNMNNHVNSQQANHNENSQSPERNAQKDSVNRRELQTSLNEPDINNIFKKMQPDYTSMMEMLSHRNKEIQKLSNYKLNLSEKLMELRTQVHLLQSTQKRNSLQDVVQQGMKSFTNSTVSQALCNKGVSPTLQGNNQIPSNNPNQEEQQALIQQQYEVNHNEEVNTASNFQNSIDNEVIQASSQNNNINGNELNNVYVQGTNGYMHNNQVMSLNMMQQSLTNDEIIFPLSTKSQGVPSKDSGTAANTKVHHLSNDFGINKENLLFSQRANGNVTNSTKNDRNLLNSSKKKKTPSQPSKVPKQAQVFKFNNIKYGDASQSTHQIISNHEMEVHGEQHNSSEFNILQEQQNEILRQITAPLSSKSIRNDQMNTLSSSSRNFTSVGNQQISQNQMINNQVSNFKKLQNNPILQNQYNSYQQNQISPQQNLEDDQYQQNSGGKKTNVSIKKSSKDFLLDKLQSENQIQQQKFQNRNYPNVNTLISTSASMQPNSMSPILMFPATTTAKSSYQQAKISNNSPIFYKSNNQLQRGLNQSKKKNIQTGGTSARLKDQDSHRMNKLQQQQNAKCSTTENSKVYRRLSTNDGNIQNYSSENIIINSNTKNGSSNCSQGNGILQQDQASQQILLHGNSTLLSNGNSTYFPLTKKEIPQPNMNQGNGKGKNPPSMFKNGSQQNKILLSNAQSYTTSNNSTNGNTQLYSTNYQNLSSQAENGQSLVKNIQHNNFIQQNSNSTQENLLTKSTPNNQNSYQQQILSQQDQFIPQNVPFNTLKSNCEDIQFQINQDQSSNIALGLQMLKQKMVRVLSKYQNKQALLENFNRQLLQKLDKLKI